MSSCHHVMMAKNLKTGTWKKVTWFPKPKKWPRGCRFPSRLGTLCSVQVLFLMCGLGSTACLPPLEQQHQPYAAGLHLSNAPWRSWTWRNEISHLNLKLSAMIKITLHCMISTATLQPSSWAPLERLLEVAQSILPALMPWRLPYFSSFYAVREPTTPGKPSAMSYIPVYLTLFLYLSIWSWPASGVISND